MKSLRAILLVLLISGCSSLRPVVDQTRYFLLSSSPPQQAIPNADYIAITQIELPEYLRRREIAWRSSDQEIHYASNLQWAEPLDKMIGRVLASQMGALVAPNFRRTEVQAEITISFAQFESDETGQVAIEANWTIRYSSGKVERSKAKISSSGPPLTKDPAGAAAELSQGLAKLATEILRAMQSTP